MKRVYWRTHPHAVMCDMKCLRPILLVSLLTLVCAGVRSAPRQSTGANPKEKESRFIKPETIQGCYELGALNWKPDLQLDKDEAVFVTPPERIELLAKRGNEGREKNGYLVRPAPGVTQSVHRSTYWMPTGPKRIEIVFTTGTSGLEMQLTAQGETLQGKAKTFWDFLRRSQTAQVISHKVDCGWRKLDAGPFSILAPSGWKFHQLQGVDSFVGEFGSDGVVLTFDFGGYSSGYLKKAKKPEYVVAHESIGGHSARIVSPRTPGHGTTGVYFRNAGHSSGLCLFGRDLTSDQQELALKIFGTIQFGGPVPRYVLPPPPAKDVQ